MHRYDEEKIDADHYWSLKGQSIEQHWKSCILFLILQEVKGKQGRTGLPGKRVCISLFFEQVFYHQDGESYAMVITWLRAHLSFEILRSVHISVRGSRISFRYANDFLEAFRLNVNAAEVFI